MADSKFKLLHKALVGNPSLLETRVAMKGVLSDVFPDKAEVSQYLAAMDIGIVQQLIDHPIHDTFFVNGLYLKMQANTGYSQEIAKRSIDAWLSWVDADIVAAYKEAQRLRTEVVQTKGSTEEDNTAIEQVFDIPSGAILVPCGVGKNDNGFLVSGIQKTENCNHPASSIYSLIYHYLLRTDHIDEINGIPTFIKNEVEKNAAFEPNYQTIFRLMLLILLLVRNNYARRNELSFSYDGTGRDLKLAFACINHYAELFSRLAGIHFDKLAFHVGDKPTVSLDNDNAEIYIKNYAGRSTSREMWYAPAIVYRLSSSNEADMTYLLREISPYSEFRPGQYEALCRMLNTRAHSICIMPTGSGKSLIYYLSALLQPGVTIIVSPTEILIEDQIRNLQRIHDFSDATELRYTGKNCFVDQALDHKLLYLTPETFQNRDLLKEFILWNQTKKLSFVVLDEIHCISNWSHDFRPEYLMLSRYLNSYLDRVFFKGYTATANYSVMRDVEQQLGIKDDNIVSPVALKKPNMRYAFLPCKDRQEMVEKLSNKLRASTRIGQKTLVFTKTDAQSEELANNLEDELKFESAIYTSSNRSAYRSFADNKCKVLITTDELGVGIDLADVNNVIHYGLPVSKGEYVQQIGRAGRDGSTANSLVVYLECNSQNVADTLLHRRSTSDDVLSMLNEENDGDYYVTYRKIFGETVDRERYSKLIADIYRQHSNVSDYAEIEYPQDGFSLVKKGYYALYAMSLIHNWSVCDNRTIGVSINRENRSLPAIKESFTEYLQSVGNSRRYIYSVANAKDYSDIIASYLEWYYDYFVYYHREQFLDMLAFFEGYKTTNKENYSSEIAERLSSYFSLQMLDISRDEAKYTKLNFMSITQAIRDEADHQTRINIERLNQNSYHVKLDWFLLTFEVLRDELFQLERLERIANNVSEAEYLDLLESAAILYQDVSETDRASFFEVLNSAAEERGIDFGIVLDTIFRANPKDIVYYGECAKRINAAFGRVSNVR